MAMPLPILCVEDGVAILRFSEIFGIHEPLRKGEKREHRPPITRGLPMVRFDWKNECYLFAVFVCGASVLMGILPVMFTDRYKSLDFIDDFVEEDEEEFLKGSSQSLSQTKQVSVVHNDVSESNDVDLEFPKFGFLHTEPSVARKDDHQSKDSCHSAEPMKGDFEEDLSWKDHPFIWTNFYPLDQQDWEDEIIWGNSPIPSNNNIESCEVSGPELGVSGGSEIEIESGIQNIQLEPHKILEDKDHNVLLSSPVSLEAFGSRDSSEAKTNLISRSLFHPQLLRLESRSEVDNSRLPDGKEGEISKHNQSGQITRFSKAISQNRDMMEGSWLDEIIWEELDQPVVKPKLIFDLQDDQMHFEVLDSKDGAHLRLHAGAIILTRSSKSSSGDSSEVPGHGQYGWRYVSNDKHYSNRKTSQQLKSNSKKRSAHGVKVFHSQPALKLQTMKLKLSNKDIANFHRPKALWYPHDNEVAVKEQGKLPTQGPMKIIIKSLGGKGSKLHVDTEETLSTVKAKASKKLGRELEDQKSLAEQNVQPNSLLHLVRSKIHLWPKAQRVPGENKSLRPPGAFKKKSDLSVKDGHNTVQTGDEEGNIGMMVMSVVVAHNGEASVRSSSISASMAIDNETDGCLTTVAEQKGHVIWASFSAEQCGAYPAISLATMQSEYCLCLLQSAMRMCPSNSQDGKKEKHNYGETNILLNKQNEEEREQMSLYALYSSKQY
ncbi:hypothetical protein V8G54_014166 [Vigna mungo]|uniref:Ubiquitin-like domain-containing protein n=1 Tax=Vigna mungo TaxID=3915 RepID=A0AAQ3NIJ8_VIGMU